MTDIRKALSDELERQGAFGGNFTRDIDLDAIIKVVLDAAEDHYEDPIIYLNESQRKHFQSAKTDMLKRQIDSLSGGLWNKSGEFVEPITYAEMLKQIAPKEIK